MAVNYGLGGFEGGSCFSSAYYYVDQTINVVIQNAYYPVNSWNVQNLGQDAGEFSTNYHLFDFDRGKFYPKRSGVFLINYNFTSITPTNNTIGASIRVNAASRYAVQQSYCRSGDFFEVGGMVLVYMEKGDYFAFECANTDATTDIVLSKVNMSVIHLKNSGRINE